MLRRGDVVTVLDADEILQTLDQDGALDGLPFMPEMLDYCGRTLRVAYRAERTCVELSLEDIPIREFIHRDVVLLEDLRCSGSHHGGCQRGCTLFWKESWLRKADAEGAGSERPPEETELDSILPRLRTRTDQGKYICQSTRLKDATRPLSKSRKLVHWWRELRHGNSGPFRLLRATAGPIWRKLRAVESTVPSGPHERTPTEELCLRAGEMVETKPLKEIVATLDRRGRNRGLRFNRLLRPYLRRRFEVRERLDRMIVESTGELREVKNTVTLSGATCHCPRVIGGCPRGDLVYWREIWLKRVERSNPR